MGTGIPLLNEYKQEFLWKRFPQSLLGGPKLRFEDETPVYVYLSQILLYILPVLFGVVLTTTAELTSDDVATEIYAYIYGGLMFLTALIFNIISAVSQAKKRSAVSPVPARRVNLTDEDEVIFESCCGSETIEFVIPGKKFKLNIIVHPLITGLISGMGFLYLVPENLNNLYNDNLAATVIVCGLGWLVMMTGLYSIMVHPPPEWAQFRSIDARELYTPLMRPFYIVAFCAVDIAAMYYPTELLLCNQILHVIFLLLPFMWTFGLLPPLDALFLWVLEQGHVILFGGSPMASDIRTLVYSLLSVLGFLITFLVSNAYGRVVIMSSFGFILSLNLGGFMEQHLHRFSKEKSETLTLMSTCQGFLWHWRCKEVLFYVLFWLVAVGAAVGVFAASQQTDLTDIGQYLGLAAWALVVLDVVLSQMQCVYVLFGLVRNKLFPKSVARTAIFIAGKKKLRILGMIRRVLIEFVAPFMMMAYLGMSLGVDSFGENNISSSINSSTLGFDVLGAARAYRWAWQSSFSFVLEVGVVSVLWEMLPATSPWASLSLGMRLLVVSVARDRLMRVAGQLRAALAVALSTWLEPKQRRPSTVPWLVVNAVLFPLLVLLPVALASFLAAPLLPIFTLPVFLVGFPRPGRFWANAVGASANVNDDTAFYHQLTPQLCKALRRAFADGSMGEPWAGNHYMARFQDRLVWLQVVERGFGYCALAVKGLELQETSCHTVEASRVDDIMDVAFEQESVPCCTFNKYPLCSLTPRDAVLVETYSDAKNQLTGIIDSPDTIKAVAASFIKTLTWVLLHDVYSTKNESMRNSIVPGKDDSYSCLPASNSSIIKPLHSLNKLCHNHKRNSHDSMKSSKIAPFATALSCDSFDAWSDNDSILSIDDKGNRTESSNLIHHIRGFNNNAQKPPPLDDSGSHSISSLEMETIQSTPRRHKTMANHFEDIDPGMPVQQDEPWTPLKRPGDKLPYLVRPPSTCNNMINMTDPLTMISTFSLHLLPLSKWLQVPQAAQQIPEDVTFSQLWYRHVVKLLPFPEAQVIVDAASSSADVAAEVAGDESLCAIYEQLVIACHNILNVLGSGGKQSVMPIQSLSAMHVYKIYSGNIPWSKPLDWLTEDTHLNNLVLKAYRYAVKLAIEQAILGGEELSYDEIQEYLEEYDGSWYIGSEKEAAWSESVAQCKPQLFSLTHDPIASVYKSRVLSLTQTPVYLGALNSELVRAQWANLNLELYYLTNDDEERYSIQANATLLRNLTVQAADPPLGYPIYASQPISIPTL